MSENPRDYSIHMNQETFEYFLDCVKGNQQYTGSFEPNEATVLKVTSSILAAMYGLPVYVDAALPTWNKKWVFPEDPFITYEKADEKWARPLGYGREVDDVGNYYIIQIQKVRHNVMINQYRKACVDVCFYKNFSP